MATPFIDTQQALLAEASRTGRGGLTFMLVLLGLWLTWFFCAEVGIHQVGRAWVEVERNVHVIAPSIEGRIRAAHVTVGADVESGAVLVELDDSAVLLRGGEQQAKLDSARTQLEATNAELVAQQRALATLVRALPMADAELRLRYERAHPAAELAEEELTRARSLKRGGFVTDLQVLAREVTARQRRGEVDELQLEMARQTLAHQVDVADRQSRIERLRREAAEAKGGIAAIQQAMAQTQNEQRQHVLRAPIAGSVADADELRPGTVVRAGEHLATILPSSRFKAIAQLSPSAIGQVRRGQRAVMRLDGFPAEQYGRVYATVLHVAQEPRMGTVRVELAILPSSAAIPFQHALPGNVAIEIGHSSPVMLVWRRAGGLLRRATTTEES